MPSIAPRAIKGDRINGTHMNITWKPLTLIEARGIILSYTVMYTPNDRTRGVHTVSTNSQANYVIIGDLDPSKGYLVEVWANTSAGVGDSSSTTVETPPSPNC